MILRLIESHWLKDTDEHGDYCLHGFIELKINDKLIDIIPKEISVSSTGLFLLRTITEDYDSNHNWGNYFFPCCGFTFYKNEAIEEINKNFLVINQGCLNGIDIIVNHFENKVRIGFESNFETIPLGEYKKIVLEFINKIEEKYGKSKKKKIKNKYEREGYESFWKEWKIRKSDLTIASS